MSLKVWLKGAVPALILVTSILVSLVLSRSTPRTFTFVVREVSFRGDVGSLDSPGRIRVLRAHPDDRVNSAPCPSPTSQLVANQLDPDAGAASAACDLQVASSDEAVELRAEGNSQVVDDLSLAAVPVHHPDDDQKFACTSTLRVDSRAPNAALVRWVVAGAACAPRATLLVAPRMSLRVTGLSLAGAPLSLLGGPEREKPLNLDLPLREARALELEVDLSQAAAEGSERADAVPVELWNGTRPLRKIQAIPAAAVTFDHVVGLTEVLSARCDASPANRVQLASYSGDHVNLQRIAVTREGLELSLTVEGPWLLDTGTCRISAMQLERTHFWLLFLSQVALLAGIASWIKDWFRS